MPATQEHVDSLKGRLRKGDLEEIAASSGRDPDEALQESFNLSRVAWAGRLNGKVICIFGAASFAMMAYTGSPWLLGSDEMLRASLEVGKQTRYYVREMRCQFHRLENFIDARQRVSIRWLKYHGFTMEEAAPHGVLGLPFHKFWMEGTK